jgi:hypothetical protein
VVWASQSFVPGNGDVTSPANTALLTHTVYNQLGQVVETDTYQDGAIVLESTHAGSALVWTSEEVAEPSCRMPPADYKPLQNVL